MQDIASFIAEIEEEQTLAAVREGLAAGADPLSMVEELRRGISVVGERFEAKQYFLPDLIMSAEIFKECIALIEPQLPDADASSKGGVVIGTVKGDIHDIGKNLVATMLRLNGFAVHDLGVDQPPEAFLTTAQECGAKLVALSGLLTIAYDSMKQTVEAVAAAGMRDGTKIIIGGGPVNGSVLDYSGADGWGKDPAEAVRFAEQYAG